jgi:MraZ protein
VVLSFTGEHTQKVDGKGRMSIPADFRRVLESGDPDWTTGLNPRLYLLYGDHLKETLHVYTMAGFSEIADQINAMPRGDASRTRLSRLILGQSIKLEVDKDGRCVMPIRQRQKLGLTEGDVYFSGVGDHFEVWKAETFAQTVGQSMHEWLDAQPDDFDPLSLLGT